MGIKSKQLKQLGFTDDVVCSLIVNIIAKYYKHTSDEEVLSLLRQVKENTASYWDDEIWCNVAERLMPKPVEDLGKDYALNDKPLDFPIYGADGIEELAIRQMQMAMRLPVSVRGALMPDAHTGYGLPIGGVLATDGVVIPYAVGLDIGCRMQISLYREGESYLNRYGAQIERALLTYTHFGMEGGLNIRQDHEVLHRAEFREIPLLNRLKNKARLQLGSSGRGNHFVEFGMVDLPADNPFDLGGGQYLAILSHSGSRGLGAEVARYYCELARERCRLPREAQHFAWLDIDSEEGQAYWKCMQLAGDYAEANHAMIHYHLGKALGLKPILTVGNHHNFAWRTGNSKQIVHRKGATPAARGEIGIIPGSMGTSGYLVEGLGNDPSLGSASHGSGRRMSRADARNSVTWSSMNKLLQAAGVKLIGGSLEESPTAYKDIDAVMESQKDLVRIVGKFSPRIVRMNKE